MLAARQRLTHALSDALPGPDRLDQAAHLRLLARMIKAADADEAELLLEEAPIAKVEHWADMIERYNKAPARAARKSLPPYEQRMDLN